MASPRYLAPALRYGAVDHSPRVHAAPLSHVVVAAAAGSAAACARASPEGYDSGRSSRSASSCAPSPEGSAASGESTPTSDVDRRSSASSTSSSSSTASKSSWNSGRSSGSRGSFASNPLAAQFSRESLSGYSGLDLTLDMDEEDGSKTEKSPMSSRSRYLPPRSLAHSAKPSWLERFLRRLNLHAATAGGLGKIITLLVFMFIVLIVLCTNSLGASEQQYHAPKPVRPSSVESLPQGHYRRAQLVGPHPTSSFDDSEHNLHPEDELSAAALSSGSKGVSAKGQPQYGGDVLYLNTKPNPPPHEVETNYLASDKVPLRFASDAADHETQEHLLNVKLGRRGGQIPLGGGR
ncbi:BZ3500_MvSof-1268-A1-R1_Chr11-1g03257 [Microbotryum saponariae]|uniref:BZ3500_MvSof-1268-A1-R1_Chr11-1g03257 protein n=1 Tax=Microbotryum saponariae TaxID=289078 RepID=A0A2X0LWL7_9BASI|nr:BZ3501_MvSof-1269-A2-R1_Chr11g02832 [Microbotryum saponariae]SDA03823.1 BZ3500_MvSof-1268-A1-R1_Chr11-1g03257 [Microbotryum saponariae]